MITVFKAETPKLEKQLNKIRNRLFDWSALTQNASYKKTCRRVFRKVLAPDEIVRRIIADIRKQGDKALLKYTKEIDGISLGTSEIQVNAHDLLNAYKNVPSQFRKALRTGISNVSAFQKKVLASATQLKDTHFTRRNIPVQSAGIYIPGGLKGSTPLASSVYMNIIPAKVAGVKDLVVCTPPGPDGTVSPYLLTALSACGVEKVYRAGGAQAVAAMALGTKTIPAVDMIAGPGNLFVTLAKKELLGTVGIDMLAGPSEVLIIADGSANPAYIAADLLGQAEHDPLASSILVTTAGSLADQVKQELSVQSAELQRSGIVKDSLREYGAVILVKSMKQAAEIANRVAPEHLEIMTADPSAVSKQIVNAGTIFLGEYSPEAIGDYIAGPSHTLPTGGTARFFSGLSVDTFMKKTSIVYFPKAQFSRLADQAMTLAQSEGLDAHMNSVKVRLK